MPDNDFADRLYRLRKAAGLSQAQLGEKVGLTNKAVSKWESGRTKPGLDAVKRLADVLGVNVQELLESSPREKKTIRIVVTGGPCAGRTTAMSRIQGAFTKRGWAVLFADDTAAQLSKGGASPGRCASRSDFHLRLLQLQLAKEQAFAQIGESMRDSRILLVCDGGAMDSCARMTEEEAGRVFRQLQADRISLRDRYDAVFHLVTAAKGAQRYYADSGGRSARAAAALDDSLVAAWTGHPHFRVIDNSTGFEEKMQRLLAEIGAFVGEPAPLEIERKFLIERPSARALERRPNCERVDIVQTYLKSADPAEERRIRQRGANGSYVCTLTRKRRISGLKRVELEERLTLREYISLLAEADPAFRPIRKKRYCLSENGLYYEIDVYPEWKDKAIMEIELSGEDSKIAFPDGISVIREVTDEKAYSNYELARIRPKEEE